MKLLPIKTKISLLLVSYFVLSLTNLLAQSLRFTSYTLDAGSFDAAYEIVYEFKAYNASNEKLFILRTDAASNCKVQYEKKLVMPSDTVSIFVTYAVQRSGNVVEQLKLYTSDRNEPQQLSIKAYVKELAMNSLQACHPMVNQKKRSSVLHIEENLVKCSITVIDSITKKVIPNTQLLLKDAMHSKEANTGAWGEYNFEITKGVIRVTASKEGYVAKEVRIPTNQSSVHAVIELVRIHPEQVIVDEVVPVVIERDHPNDNLPMKDTSIVRTTPQAQVQTESTVSNEELPLDRFKPNHLIFLLDKSASMRENNKLNRVKESMKCIASHLRSCDYITIIVYDVLPNVLFEKVQATQLQRVYHVLDSVEAHKQTMGGKAIAKAYDVGIANYIAGANNEIIMSTDGAFKLDDAFVKSLGAAPNNKLKMSVLSFDTTMPDYLKLLKLTKHTGGEVIQVKDLSKLCEQLLEEVKLRSLKTSH